MSAHLQSVNMRTREKIVLSAVELFIQQGIARTTTKEIAASAGVAEGSIYRYFRSKDEMAWQIFDEYHLKLADQLKVSMQNQSNIVNKVEAMVNCFLKMADDDWLMFRYYLTSQHTHMARVNKDVLTPYKVIITVIDEAIRNKEIKVSDSSVIAAMLMGAVHQIGINKIYGRITGKLKNHKQQISETVLKMLDMYEGTL